MSWARGTTITTVGTAGTTVPNGSYTAAFTIPQGAVAAWAIFSDIINIEVEHDGVAAAVEEVSGGWQLTPPLGFVAPLGADYDVKFKGVSASCTVTLFALTL